VNQMNHRIGLARVRGWLLWVTLIISSVSCTQAPVPDKKVDNASQKKTKTQSAVTANADSNSPHPKIDSDPRLPIASTDATDHERPVQPAAETPDGNKEEEYLGTKIKKIPAGPAIELVRREVQLQDDSVKYVIFAPAKAEVESGIDTIRIHGGDHFDLTVQVGSLDIKEIAKTYGHDPHAKVIATTPDSVIARKLKIEFGQYEQFIETHQFFINRTIGHREFTILNSSSGKMSKSLYFNAKDYQVMMQAAGQFTLAEPLPEEPAELLKRLGGNLYRNLEGTMEAGETGDFVYASLPYRTATGSTLALLEHFPKLVRLEAPLRHPEGQQWSVLAKLPLLEILNINGTKFLDGFAEIVCGLPKLKVLNVGDHETPMSAVKILERAKSLEKLTIFSGALTDNTLDQFPTIPNLRDLEIHTHANTNGVEYNGSGLGFLVKLPHLEILRQSGRSITDDGLEAIGKLKTLKELELAECNKITAAGLKHLTNLTNLEKLDLSYVKLNDDAVDSLCALSSLKSLKLLNLEGNNFTDAGFAKIKAALPGCEIKFK
jgi:hypothetical protein